MSFFFSDYGLHFLLLHISHSFCILYCIFCVQTTVDSEVDNTFPRKRLVLSTVRQKDEDLFISFFSSEYEVGQTSITTLITVNAPLIGNISWMVSDHLLQEGFGILSTVRQDLCLLSILQLKFPFLPLLSKSPTSRN